MDDGDGGGGSGDDGGGDDPPGGGCDWGCDPGEVEVSASLACSVGVVRGTEGVCTLTVEPSEQLQYIYRWVFESDGGAQVVKEPGVSAEWRGILVESGDVRVVIRVNGADMVVASRITVAPRNSGIWTDTHWQSVVTFIQGQGSSQCQQSQRTIAGVRLGWTGTADPNTTCQGQRIEPIGSAGYQIGMGTGPNNGIRYVFNSSFYLRSTSQLHSDVHPTAPAHSLFDAQQSSLCLSMLGTSSVNFSQFNAGCAQVPGWAGFVNALWNHERQHFEQARTALTTQPGNNIYLELEGVTRTSDFDITQAITTTYNRIQSTVSSAGGVEPTGNWTTDFWVWISDADNRFQLLQSVNF